MAYSTKEQVRQLLKGLQSVGDQFDSTADDLTDAQIEYEIDNADNQIDLSLRRVYSVPLANPVPKAINSISIDIAASLSDMTYRGSREYGSELSPFRLRYERAVLLLERIAEGTYPLYNDGEGPDTTGTAIVINPYPGDVLLTKEVFPRARGLSFGNNGSTEYAETERYPYNYGR